MTESKGYPYYPGKIKSVRPKLELKVTVGDLSEVKVWKSTRVPETRHPPLPNLSKNQYEGLRTTEW